MRKAPKEFHFELDFLYDQICRDRERSNNFGTKKTKRKACRATVKIVPFKILFKSIYDSYLLELKESKIVD